MAPDRAGAEPPRVIVVGAGPGALAATTQLRERAGDAVDVVLVASRGRASHLAGVLPIALGTAEPAAFTGPVAPAGVRVIAATADAFDGERLHIGDDALTAAAVIAAPGLELDTAAVPAWPRASVMWDLAGAEAAAAPLDAVPGGNLVIAVCSLPYRCPPAPYSLAMELAHRHRRSGRFTKVLVATPEPMPLAGVGGEAPGFLMEGCAGAGVEVVRSFAVDLAASEDGVLRSHDGRELDYRHAVIIPPHVRVPLLAGLAGDGPLVEVDGSGATSQAALYAVGDCAATGLPRAAGVAQAAGRTAADAVLAGLGLCAAAPAHEPSASCFIWQGGGSLSKINVSYPDGPPPGGTARVRIDGPSPDLAYAVDGERRRFLELAAGADEPF